MIKTDQIPGVIAPLTYSMKDNPGTCILDSVTLLATASECYYFECKDFF